MLQGIVLSFPHGEQIIAASQMRSGQSLSLLAHRRSLPSLLPQTALEHTPFWRATTLASRSLSSILSLKTGRTNARSASARRVYE
jgi:hypothetical protein